MEGKINLVKDKDSSPISTNRNGRARASTGILLERRRGLRLKLERCLLYDYQACKIAILSLFFACSFQNFISSQYSADGSLHQPPRNPSSIADQKEILYIRFQGW
jgi:hypothetical protein